MPAIGLKTQIWNNNLRSLLLMGVYPFLLMGIVWAIAAAGAGLVSGTGFLPEYQDGSGRAVSFANEIVAAYWVPVLAVVALWFVVAWFYHTSMVRMMTHAHPVTRAGEPELYNMLENLCISRGMKMPKLEIIESHACNAFASGINDGSYTITLTRGLLNTLRADEVEAVIGHELTHIINRDVRLLMVCIIFTGMIGFCAQWFFSMARHGVRIPSKRGNNTGVIIMILFGILWLGYLASALTRFAVSRSREYMADAGAVELTRNPEAMMRALMRISGRDQIPEVTDDIAMMCIENTRPFLGIFATHPPIAARIQAIAATSGISIPALAPHGTADTAERFQQPGEKEKDGNTLSRKSRNPWA